MNLGGCFLTLNFCNDTFTVIHQLPLLYIYIIIIIIIIIINYVKV